jgi:hypothetical protein
MTELIRQMLADLARQWRTRRRLAGLALLAAGCTPAPLQTVVHVTTYEATGTTDIVERRLLYRGKLAPDTLATTLAAYHLSLATPVTSETK